MGEIADALRKANAEQAAAREHAPPSARSPRADAEHAATGSLPEREPPRSRAAAHEPPPAEPVGSELEPMAEVRLDGQPPAIDLVRHLALRLRTAMDDLGVRSVAVVSPLRNEGKTTVASHLALALASLSAGGSRVALVDLDLRNPSIAGRFGLEDLRTGVDEVLLGRSTLDDACVPLSAPRIDIYPALKPRAAAHELLVRPSFADTIRELNARYETVVVDTPPTLLVPDSTLILQHVGCCAPVANSGATRVRMFKKMLAMLPQAKIAGTILNGAPTEKHERDYYTYGYGHGEDASDG